jgi:hypothetical protein
VEVVKPKVTRSGNGTKFQSPLLKETMQKYTILLKFDILPSDTRKAIHVKGTLENFKILQDLLSLNASEVGRINSSHTKIG